MGVIVETTAVDDLDGSTPAKNIKFGINGVQYEIDLGSENEEKLRKIFSEFIPCARRVPRKKNISVNKKKKSKEDK